MSKVRPPPFLSSYRQAAPTHRPRTGLPLYLASSAFVRHTLGALYTDLRVELERVRVHGPRSPGPRADADPQSPDDPPSGPGRTPQSRTRSTREKSLFVGLTVHGTNRVSKADGGWQVCVLLLLFRSHPDTRTRTLELNGRCRNSTYTFSPVTGLIHIHNIDSIHPAPHQAFFNALQAALSKLGLGRPEDAAGAGGVARTLPGPHPAPVPSVPNRS